MKLPRWVEVTHYQRGDVLWHGTSMDYAIVDLEGPAWVSNSHNVASWFAHWKANPGEGAPRVMKYVVEAPFTLPTFDGRILQQMPSGGRGRLEFPDWVRRLITRNAEDIDYDDQQPEDIREMAEDVCRAGHIGWRIVNNYDSGDDILICHPERYLRRVQAGRHRRPR